MESAPAIEVVEVSKTFLIPHEQRRRLKEYFAHPLRRTTYERNEALKAVTFDVARGEFFGVVGRNGSGKSTLLKILARIYRADTGIVHVNGKLSAFIELGVGFNFDLSARENIEINGLLLGLTGMLLRLAYSIAIQVPFEVLLLDEVLAVGDANFQAKCFDTFDTMRKDGKTVVFVSHDLSSVERFCDRALYLNDGMVQCIGETKDVVEVYREREAGSIPHDLGV